MFFLVKELSQTQKFKLLGEISGYDLYYSLTHLLKWKPFRLETCTCLFYLVLNFYQINRNDEIRTHDRLVINVLIPCQRTISTQKFKLLGEVSGYDLYYSLTFLSIIFTSVSIHMRWCIVSSHLYRISSCIFDSLSPLTCCVQKIFFKECNLLLRKIDLYATTGTFIFWFLFSTSILNYFSIFLLIYFNFSYKKSMIA